VAVVAHDAGAARLLFSWLESLDHQLNFCATGPAQKMLQRERPTTKIFSDPRSCLKGCKLLLSGTGWSSSIEHQARLIASKQSIKSIAVLDHWVNYQERFMRNGISQLPDNFWVSDEEAKKIATNLFPSIPATQLPNLWMNDVISKVEFYRAKFGKKAPQLPAKNLLYLSEPTRDRNSGKQTHEELQHLEHWISQIPMLTAKGWVDPYQAQLRIRIHPSEALTKYDDWTTKYTCQWPLSIDKEASLEKSLAQADLAFGYETQALVAAVRCGIKAISCTPPQKERGRLPHQEILRLDTFNQGKQAYLSQ